MWHPQTFLIALGVGISTALLMVPAEAKAAVFGAGEAYTLTETEVLSGDLYAVAAELLSLAGSVYGDASVAGKKIVVPGSVGADLHAAGATVQVLGTVAGDARLAGAEVLVSAAVGEDVVILGDVVRVLSDTVIEGDVHILARHVEFDGTVRGALVVRATALVLGGAVTGSTTVQVSESLTLTDGASLAGALAYRAPTELFRSEGAQIAGSTTFSRIEQAEPKRFDQLFASSFVFLFLFLFVSSTVFVAFFRTYATRVVVRAIDTRGRTVFTGLLCVFLVPFAALLLMVSMLGTLLGFLLALLYLLCIILAMLLSGTLAGALMTRWHQGQETVSWQWTGAGVFVLRVISLVPVLGFLVNAFMWLAVFGALWEDLYVHLFRRKKMEASTPADTVAAETLSDTHDGRG